MDEFELLFADFGVTEDLYNMKFPNPTTMLYYQNLAKRRIWLDTDVSEDLLDFERYILHWNEQDEKANIAIEDRQPIYLYIYTVGGGVSIANSLIDIIKISKTPVYTINMGISLSAGALILVAGTKRFVMPNSQTLIHQGGIEGVSGTTSQVIETVENIKKEEAKIKAYILENTNISEELYDRNAKAEWYLTAEEAIKYGVADKIIDSMSELY